MPPANPKSRSASALLSVVSILLVRVGAAPAAQSQPASLDITLGVAADREHDAALIEKLPADAGQPDVLVDGGHVGTWFAIDPSAEAEAEEGQCVLRTDPASGRREILVLMPTFTVWRDDIEGIRPTTDEMGELAAAIRLDEQASRALRATTARWKERRAAFVVNGSVRFLPTVRASVGALMIAGPYAAEYLALARDEGFVTARTEGPPPVDVGELMRWWALWVGGPVALGLVLVGLIALRKSPCRVANWWTLGGFLVGCIAGAILVGSYTVTSPGPPPFISTVTHGFSLLWGGIGGFVGAMLGAAAGCAVAAIVRRRAATRSASRRG